ncbi:MAG TPA: class I SAM-dependent methyltransferase [Chloroflexi bacterium]|nr:class I SAM-dependent methyltransferase [Chloroflexota bacterium]
MRSRSFIPNLLSDERKLPAKEKWNKRYANFNLTERLNVTPFLGRWLPKLPQRGLALDIAAGGGRNSYALARRGLTVNAVDISCQGLHLLKRRTSPGWDIQPIALNLERGWLPKAQYQVIVNFFFLERAIWPILKSRLAPGGWLIIETFTVDQLQTKMARQKYIRRDFLLEKGELLEAFKFLKILYYDEGEHQKGFTAQLVGRAMNNE